jgi:hypothetical protein
MGSVLPRRLAVQNFGPIQDADVSFGDLNVVVGPQASGKSLFFQLLKLLVDADAICHEFLRFSTDWGTDFANFMHLYFGQGAKTLLTTSSIIALNGRQEELAKVTQNARRRVGKIASAASPAERVFYIPAQRIMAVQDGRTRTFNSFSSGDPYVIRKFSDTLHGLVQSEFSAGDSDKLFPKRNRLNEGLRRLVADSFFHGFDLEVARGDDLTKRLVLTHGDTSLSFMTWSAGQREFTPLLLGLYWLLPAGAVSRRDDFESVVIEEPEMGLHPRAIQAFMALVLELMRRGYRIFLSTHSPAVMDVIWGLQTLKAHGGKEKDVRDLLGLPASLKDMAETALEKKITVSYFQPGEKVVDISQLDPGADSPAESGWGGLTSFSGDIGDVVARVVSRHEAAGAVQ